MSHTTTEKKNEKTHDCEQGVFPVSPRKKIKIPKKGVVIY
jgi:hypothetical protein